MLKAAIDIGSNTIQMLFARKGVSGLSVLEHSQEVTALGTGLNKSKKFDAHSEEKSIEVLSSYAKRLAAHGVDPKDVLVMATEACRQSISTVNFFGKITKTTKLLPQLLTTYGEAYISSYAVCTDIDEEELLIVDIGGASTEITLVERLPFKVVKTISLKLGTVAVSEWLKSGELETQLMQVLVRYADELQLLRRPKLYCVHGSMTTIFNMVRDNREKSEMSFHKDNLSSQFLSSEVEKYLQWGNSRIANDFPYIRQREKTILGLLHLVRWLVFNLKPQSISLSNMGLVHGALAMGEIPANFKIFLS